MKKNNVKRPITPQKKQEKTQLPTLALELDVAEGLEWLAAEELRRRFGRRIEVSNDSSGGRVSFRFQGEIQELNTLRVTQAVFHVQTFDVPRPKALLGDQHFRVVKQNIQTVKTANKPA